MLSQKQQQQQLWASGHFLFFMKSQDQCMLPTWGFVFHWTYLFPFPPTCVESHGFKLAIKHTGCPLCAHDIVANLSTEDNSQNHSDKAGMFPQGIPPLSRWLDSSVRPVYRVRSLKPPPTHTHWILYEKHNEEPLWPWASDMVPEHPQEKGMSWWHLVSMT